MIKEFIYLAGTIVVLCVIVLAVIITRAVMKIFGIKWKF